jgi:hypothetical protein
MRPWRPQDGAEQFELARQQEAHHAVRRRHRGGREALQCQHRGSKRVILPVLSRKTGVGPQTATRSVSTGHRSWRRRTMEGLSRAAQICSRVRRSLRAKEQRSRRGRVWDPK